MEWLRGVWENLRSSLWFVPALTTAAMVALGLAGVELDTRLDQQPAEQWPRIFGAGADGARAMLGAIAASMATIAGVAFSITIVILALASSEYTSRLVRNLMRDRVNQIVLGVLIGVFGFCLVVLRSIRGGDEGGFVPGSSVALGVVLAFVGMGAFVYFVHHMAASIQASEIVAGVAAQTVAAVPRLFPDRLSEAPGGGAAAPVPECDAWTSLPSRYTGYVQSADVDALGRVARRCGRSLRMERGVGDFATAGRPLAALAGDEEVDARTVDAVNDCYAIATFRTVQQDVGYGIRQIVDVALKALSPGINDPTTAVTCVDYLGAILCELADRRIPRVQSNPADGVCVVERGASFATFVGEAFDQIRRQAAAHPAVLEQQVGALATVASCTRDPERHAVLAQQLRRIQAAAQIGVEAAWDRAPIAEAVLRAQRTMAPEPRAEPALAARRAGG